MTDEEKKLNQNLLENLHFLCSRFQIKLGDIERMIGVSPGYVSRLSKSNHKSLPYHQLRRISQRLGVSVEDLMERDIGKEEKIKHLSKELEELTKEDEQ